MGRVARTAFGGTLSDARILARNDAPEQIHLLKSDTLPLVALVGQPHDVGQLNPCTLRPHVDGRYVVGRQ